MAKTKEQKRAEADERNLRYRRLTPSQKLERIAERRGESARERRKIEQRIGEGTEGIGRQFATQTMAYSNMPTDRGVPPWVETILRPRRR